MKTTKSVALAVIVVATVTGVTLTTGIATAQDGTQRPLGDVIEGPAEDQSRSEWASNGVDALVAGWDGARERALWWSSSLVGYGDDGVTAANEATATTTTWNSHNATLEAYANERRTFDRNETVEITWYVDEEQATRYLLANESGGNVTTRMVESTERTPTHDLDLCGYAAEQSQEELSRFISDFAEPDEDVDASYRSGLGGKYGDDVETSLYSSSGDCGDTS